LDIPKKDNSYIKHIIIDDIKVIKNIRIPHVKPPWGWPQFTETAAGIDDSEFKRFMNWLYYHEFYRLPRIIQYRFYTSQTMISPRVFEILCDIINIICYPFSL
jgi:hypothetical protein